MLKRDAPLLLDGGLATELEAAGADLSGALWSARVLLEQPERIRAAHERFFAAGADVAITASYQASFEGLAAMGVGEAEAEALLRRATELAREAAPAGALVAASVGPYGAAQADGSEYSGGYGAAMGRAALVRWHRRRFGVLAASGADLLACETVPCVAEAAALLELLAESPVPGWLSLTLAADGGGERLSSGEPLADLGPLLRAAPPQLAGVGVNCVPPDLVAPALRALGALTELPLVAYPNSGEGWDAEARGWTGRPEAIDIAELAPSWVALGARAVGGCCRVTPAEVGRVRSGLSGVASGGHLGGDLGAGAAAEGV